MDIGCGRGAWLKAFSEIYKNSNPNLEVYGLDGPWNSEDKLIVDGNNYFSIDLNKLQDFKFDKKLIYLYRWKLQNIYILSLRGHLSIACVTYQTLFCFLVPI